MQYLIPQQLRPLAPYQSFLPKDIGGDTVVGEFDGMHLLRLVENSYNYKGFLSARDFLCVSLKCIYRKP